MSGIKNQNNKQSAKEKEPETGLSQKVIDAIAMYPSANAEVISTASGEEVTQEQLDSYLQSL